MSSVTPPPQPPQTGWFSLSVCSHCFVSVLHTTHAYSPAGDGLRADKAFLPFPEPYPKQPEDYEPRPLAPFLRSKVLTDATFGVSHTHVPTESRPGHVALIAGLYEDVSAVATGWKLNPVGFDSVFNRSRHTWSWGSPDILPMFEHGAVPGRVDAVSYEPEFEDFSKDAVQLDYWVFDHVREFFAEATKNATLNRALRQDKLVFFLHLLGLDTTGHSHRPYSPEYLHNLKVVDQGVKEMTELITKFYNDDRTAFVFTADHGMTDWGMHGDGHPDNTRTPLVAWGSGIAKPEIYPGSMAPGHDEYSAGWAFDHVRRHDVEQADVAALMAYLVGVEFPANSIGKLPLSYLSATIPEKARASLKNAQGILEMYRVKEENKKTSELRYKAYEPLSEASHTPEQRVSAIEKLIADGKHEEAIEELDAVIALALEGLRYLQTYDWLFLRVLITVGYLGWMAYAITTVVDRYVLQDSLPPKRTNIGILCFSSILAAFYASFIVSKSPLTYYAYALFPVVFWEEVFARRASLAQSRRVLFRHVASTASILTLILHAVIYIAVIESCVSTLSRCSRARLLTQFQAFGYIHREMLTGLFIIGAFWPLTYGFAFVRAHSSLSSLWAGSCLVMSTFTLLPAMKVESVNLMCVVLPSDEHAAC